MKCCGFLKGTAPATRQFYKTLIYSLQPPYRGELRSVTQHNLLKKVKWKEFPHLPFLPFVSALPVPKFGRDRAGAPQANHTSIHEVKLEVIQKQVEVSTSQ